MIERLLTRNTSCSAESNLSAITVRLSGISGSLLIISLFVFAFLNGASGVPEVYQWAFPFGIWACGTIWLFVGAVRAFANSSVKDTSMSLIKICQGVTVAYLGLCELFLRGGPEVTLAIASVIELFFVFATTAFVLIAAITRTPLTRAVWFTVCLTLCATYFTIKHIVDFLQTLQ